MGTCEGKKRCKECNKIISNRNISGYCYKCRRLIYRKKYYQLNKEKIKSQSKKYHQSNKEKIKDYYKKYYLINKEKNYEGEKTC